MEFLRNNGRFVPGRWLAEKSATTQICASPAKTLWPAPGRSIVDACLVGAIASEKMSARESIKDAAR